MRKTGSSHFLLILAILFFAAYAPCGAMGGQTELHLIPIPAELTMGTGRLTLDGRFSISIEGDISSLLEQAVARFIGRLQRSTGIPFIRHADPDSENAALVIECTGKGEPVPSIRTDESYTLEVSDTRARLSAPSPVGIFHGLETLLQLVDIDENSFYIPSVRIQDRPRLRWRGLLIDVSRHFQPVEIIKKNLDAMAAVKMNVLHWHLSDDQGFRVESKSFPNLQLMGSDGDYYSQNEVKEVVAYARSLGIRVVPEFDMPGHSTSWLVGYPELAAAPGPYSIEREWGVFEPCMDPSKKKVFEFLDAFIEEMAGLFPDEYFHIGGDEVKAAQWNSSAAIQDFKMQHKLADNRALQAYFNRKVLEILAKHGKKMIGWDEIFHPDLPKDVVIQSWRGQAALADSARQGYMGILSFGYYLDHMRPASFHYEMDPLGNEASDLSPEEQTRILGGEACMWAEFVTPENIESRIWPRAAAIAERLWSPATVNDVQDLYRRLDFIDGELQALDLGYHALYLENLRRLAADARIEPLSIFANLLAPPSLAIRKQARMYYSYTPLNRLVDTLQPESRVAREFSERVDKYLSHPDAAGEDLRQIRTCLDSWTANNARLQPLLAHSYLLKETIPLAETVVNLCRCTAEAITYLQSDQIPPESWQQKASALIAAAEKPQAEIFIAVFPSMERIIEAAFNQPQ